MSTNPDELTLPYQTEIQNYYDNAIANADPVARLIIANGGETEDASQFIQAMTGHTGTLESGYTYESRKTPANVFHSIAVCAAGLKGIVQPYKKAQGSLFTLGPRMPARDSNIEADDNLYWLPPSKEEPPIRYSIKNVLAKDSDKEYQLSRPKFVGGAILKAQKVLIDSSSNEVRIEEANIEVLKNYSREAGSPINVAYTMYDSYEISPDRVGLFDVLKPLLNTSQYHFNSETAVKIGQIGLAARTLGSK